MSDPQVLTTGVPHLDEVLGGGLPIFSCQILAGGPGAGKTILAQQIVFHTLGRDPSAKALYLTTVSEPMPKVVRFMQRFRFFDAGEVGERMVFHDLGAALRETPKGRSVESVLALVERHQPDLLVIDSFKAIRDLKQGAGDFRLFVHDLVSRLAGARCTTLLLGEYARNELPDGAEFAVADGILFLETTDHYGEHQRTLQILKMRGQAADLRSVPFLLSEEGMKVLATRSADRPRLAEGRTVPSRVRTGIPGLDAMLDGGVPGGRVSLLTGRSGTGKTTLGLQFLHEGCRRGERSLLVTFEQRPDRLKELSENFGWDHAVHIEDGLLEVIYIPQSAVRVMPHLDLIDEVVRRFRPDRVVLDSLSAYLHRVRDPGTQRDMTFRLVSLIQDAGACGLLVSDVPAEDDERLSRFGVEDTVADGIILLSSAAGEYGQRRYLQVHKMRACPHVTGRERMAISDRGIEVYYDPQVDPPAVECRETVAFDIMNPLLDHGLPYGTTWLVSGPGGSGKTAVLQQFVADGFADGDSVLYVSLDTDVKQVRRELIRIGVNADELVADGRLRFLSTGGRRDRPGRVDLKDPEALLFQLNREVAALDVPTRVVIDSLWPLAARLSAEAFVALVQQKNQLLRRPHVTILEAVPAKSFDERSFARVENSFDAVLEIEPQEGAGGIRQSVLNVRKVRGGIIRRRRADLTLEPGKGLRLQPADDTASPSRDEATAG